MSLHKKGNFFPRRSAGHAAAMMYPQAIAQALRHQFGETRNAVKTVARWTGANERTVKNWFSGKSGPSGEHLIGLAHRSSDVLEVFLLLAGREERINNTKLEAIREKLSEISDLVGKRPSQTDPNVNEKSPK